MRPGKIQNTKFYNLNQTNYSDYDLIRVNKKCGKSCKKKVKEMLLQISIALTIKNLTILTKIKVR